MKNRKTRIVENKTLPIDIRSAQLIMKNGINIGEFYMIKLVDNINTILSTNVQVNQSYFIIGGIKYNSYSNPLSYTIFGSDRDCIKDIPWDFPCIKKVIGLYPFSKA
jgi:hypothetical protein